MATDLYRRALARAAQILGGWDRLADYLKSDLQRMRSWSTRRTPPPLHILLSVVQVLKQAWLKKHLRSALPSAKLLARRKKANSISRPYR